MLLPAGFYDTDSEGPSKRERELAAKPKELETKAAKKDHVIAEDALRRPCGDVEEVRHANGVC